MEREPEMTKGRHKLYDSIAGLRASPEWRKTKINGGVPSIEELQKNYSAQLKKAMVHFK